VIGWLGGFKSPVWGPLPFLVAAPAQGREPLGIAAIVANLPSSASDLANRCVLQGFALADAAF